MAEFCLFVTVVSIIVCTVIGAVWLVRGLIHLLADHPPAQPSRPRTKCRNCGTWRTAPQERCPRCGLTTVKAGRIADLEVTRKHLHEFHAAGVLDELAMTSLREELARREEEIRAPVSRLAPDLARPRATPVDEPLEVIPVVEVETSEPPPAVLLPLAAAVPPPAPPRRTWGDLVASFMEERHILWGELAGGLLIVGCSVALVLSLWQTLQRIPLFPFLILAALTTALFGVGRYTLRRWRLEASSRALLVMAVLLVPLNFLVLAGLSPRSAGAPAELAIKLAAVPLFAWLVWRAGQLLFTAGEAPWLALAVSGAGVGVLAAARLFDGPAWLWPLPAAAMVLGYQLSVGEVVRRRWREAALDTQAAWHTLGFLGLSTFPLLMALGFVVIWGGNHGLDLSRLLNRLAPLIVLAGVPLAATGLLVQRRADAQPPAVAGTAVALLGMIIHASALWLSWPESNLMVVVGLMMAATWTAAAIAYRLPLAHGPAIIGLAAAAVAGWHHEAAVSWSDLLSSETGAVVAGLAVALAAVADQLRTRQRWHHGVIHAVAAGSLMAAALALVGSDATRAPLRAAVVGATAALTCLVLEYRWSMPALGHGGALLIPLTSLAAMHYAWPGEQSRWGTLLAGEALLLSLIRSNWRPAVLLSVLSAAGTAIAGRQYAAGPHAATLALLAVVAVVQAHQLRLAALGWVGSAGLLMSIAHLLFIQPRAPHALAGPLILLTHTTLLLPALVLRRFPTLSFISETLGNSARVTSVVAAASLGWFIGPPFGVTLVSCAAWVAALWLSFAVLDREPGWYSASQAATAAATLLGVAAALGLNERLLIGLVSSFDAFALALVVLVIAWSTLRLAWRHPLWQAASWPAFERLLLGALVIAFGALAIARLVPGIAAELGRTVGAPIIPIGLSQLPLGDWLLLGLLLVALAMQFWLVADAWRYGAVLLGMLAVGLTAPLLIAPTFSADLAAGSALRWGLGIAYFVGCVPFWARGALVRAARRAGIEPGDPRSWADAGVVPGLKFALLAVGGGVPLVLTLTTMADAIGGRLPPGPRATTFFSQLGFTWSHAIPLALVALGMVGHALRDRSPGYAFGAGLLAKLLIGGGFAVAVATARLPFDSSFGVTLSQRLLLTGILWAGAWLLVARWLGRFRDASVHDWQLRPSPWWNAELGIAGAGLALLLSIAALGIAGSPEMPPWLTSIGQGPVWLALIGVLAAAWLRARFAGVNQAAELTGVGVTAAVVLIACRAPAEGGWPLRMLMLGWAGCALVWAGLALRRPHLAGGVAVTAALATVLALKAAAVHGDYSSAAAVTAAAGAAGLWLAWQRRRDDWAHTAGLGLHFATSFLVWGHFADQPLAAWWVELMQANAVASAVIAALWIGARRLRTGVTVASEDRIAWLQLTWPVAFLASTLILPLKSLLLSPEARSDALMAHAGGWPGWLAMIAITAAWASYGRVQRRALDMLPGGAGLLVGLLAACTAARWDTVNWLAFHVLVISWAATAVGVLWLGRRGAVEWAISLSALVAAFVLRAAADSAVRPLDTLLLAAFVAALAMPRFGDARLLVTNLVLGLAALGLGLFIVLTEPEFSGRICGPLATGLLVAAAGLLASAFETRRRPLTAIALWLGALALAEAALATVQPDAAAVWLHRTAAVLAALTAATVAYAFFPRRAGHWSDVARAIAPYLGLIAAGVLLLSVVQQGLLFDKVSKRTPLTAAEVGVLLLATTGLMVAAATFAVRPALDPFRVPDRWRPGYVYACEVLLVLLFLHLRFNVPGLFPRIEAQTWAFVIMAIAFAGVGLAELFRRYRLEVLAGPLQQTGLFLPLLPLLMFWMKPSAAMRAPIVAAVPGAQPLLAFFDQIPTDYGNYSILWFLFGLLYAWLAVSRQSFRHALLAALAGNVGVWSLLYHGGIPLVAHPQLWLVPLALIVLVSEQYHHGTLRPELSTGLRYVGLGLLYLSSTVDFFLAGVGNSALLPLALAVLSVLGILLGILLRVRSYLLLGTGFLALVVFSMIWHAAVGLAQTWLWWACGIALGAAIWALFALFERRRQGVLEAIDELRSWR